MNIDIAAAYDAMVKISANAVSVRSGMDALIDYCNLAFPSDRWAALRDLNYEEDEERLREWLIGVFTQEPVSPSIKAFWFGLFNPDDDVSCAFYVSGAPREYSAESLDWACFREDSYLPKNYIAESKILHAISDVVHQESVGVLPAEYVLCLGYACLVIPAIVRAVDVKLFPSGGPERAVAAGFDDGDCVLLGSISSEGYRQQSV